MALRGYWQTVVSAHGASSLAVAVLLGCGIATGVAHWTAERILERDVKRRFTIDARDTVSSVESRIRAHAEVLLNLQGLYASVGQVSRDQFHRYVEHLGLDRRYPGFEAIEVVRYLTPTELPSFVERTRSDRSLNPNGYPDFHIHPAGQRPAYYVIDYVEPTLVGEKVLGLDVGALPLELEALERGRDTGRVVATKPIKLAQDSNGQPGFVLRAPIYKNGYPIENESQRRAALAGFVAAVYRMNDLMTGVVGARTMREMHIRVYDVGYVNEHSTQVILYDSLAPNPNVVRAPDEITSRVSHSQDIVVGDRSWRFVLAARSDSPYEINHALPNLILVSGGVFSLLLAALVLSYVRTRRLAGSLGALGAEQKAILENPLSGILYTRQGTIVRSNQRMAEMCNRASEELVGLELGALFVDASSLQDVQNIESSLGRGRPVALDVRLRRQDGSTIACAAYGKMLAGDGLAGCIVWVIMDMTDPEQVETERRDHEAALREANDRLTASLQEVGRRKQQIELLTELSGMLQACIDTGEAFKTISYYAELLFPGESGALYLISADRDSVVRGAAWGQPTAHSEAFVPDDCWALRRGHPFRPPEGKFGPICGHVDEESKATRRYMCLPLVAQHQPLGLLYRELSQAEALIDPAQDDLAVMLAEQVSLAIGNLRLREQLKGQAIRDPLTGLYNRRMIEEALTRESAHSRSSGKPLALIMIDVDHFKRINDKYGHDGGDMVLRMISSILKRIARANDIAARFGGEEFLLLMPNTTLETGEQRALELLEEIRAMRVAIGSTMLTDVTASFGIALMPLHADGPEELVSAADTALYAAKNGGRNRIVSATIRLQGVNALAESA
ncbi:hypothetical protein CYFUS_005386 [Cystobacter fuscus]|uniref:diguanylate cyclase n=2 Tax=Cystobacter fuscus TaxID=43 RepID=A0A250J8Q0_9BACT|nr:hypothetical protein CYFUS_005386 [Cystobacter fuscus]